MFDFFLLLFYTAIPSYWTLSMRVKGETEGLFVYLTNNNTRPNYYMLCLFGQRPEYHRTLLAEKPYPVRGRLENWNPYKLQGRLGGWKSYLWGTENPIQPGRGLGAESVDAWWTLHWNRCKRSLFNLSFDWFVEITGTQQQSPCPKERKVLFFLRVWKLYARVP